MAADSGMFLGKRWMFGSCGIILASPGPAFRGHCSSHKAGHFPREAADRWEWIESVDSIRPFGHHFSVALTRPKSLPSAALIAGMFAVTSSGALPFSVMV